jgi:hypothetical protein
MIRSQTSSLDGTVLVTPGATIAVGAVGVEVMPVTGITTCVVQDTKNMLTITNTGKVLNNSDFM